MPAFTEADSLFFDGATNTATAVAIQGKRRGRVRHLKFRDPHAALDWCIARRARFVYLPAPTVANN